MKSEDRAVENGGVWEVVRLGNGEVFIYRGGFKEEASPRDIFMVTPGMSPSGQMSYRISRFDFNPVPPANSGSVRLNRSAITFAYYADPNSGLIQDLKKAIPEMDAKAAGLVLP